MVLNVRETQNQCGFIKEMNTEKSRQFSVFSRQSLFVVTLKKNKKASHLSVLAVKKKKNEKHIK
jgi:hypothetical protein